MSGHSYYEDYNDIRGDGGIVIYKRPEHDNPKWYARIKVKEAKGFIRKSTKTTDYEEAKRFAEDLYYELEGKVRRGETLKSPPFRRVVAEWKSALPELMDGRSPAYIEGTVRHIELYALEYFGNEPTDKINDARMLEYYHYRLTVGTKTPSNGLLKHEKGSLNKLFRFAKIKGYINEPPEIYVPSSKPNPRPDIPKRDWNTLYKYMRKYVNQAQDKRRHRERHYLQQYILILGNSGIRIGEARTLRWMDIDSSKDLEGKERVVFYVRGKTGQREVVCVQGVETYLQRLWEQRTKELGKTPDPKEPVFCSANGKAVGSYKKGFYKLLDEAGVLYDTEGKIRVPYSIRHTYITMRLNEGTSIYQLANNCGTSVEMIETFYGKKRVRNPKNVSDLTRTSKKRGGTGQNILAWKQ